MQKAVSTRYVSIKRQLKLIGFYAKTWVHAKRLRNTRVIGITGSAGKTTTKDLVSAILSSHGGVVRTEGTRNSTRRISELICSASPKDPYLVIEFSADRPGSLDIPLFLIKPDIAVFISVGRDHYSAFRSLEAIAEEKSKLVSALSSSGIAVLNMDDPLVRAAGERCSGRIVWVGRHPDASIRLAHSASQWPDPLCLTVVYEGKTHNIRTSMHGGHLTPSVLCALGVATAAGVSIEDAIASIEKATPTEGRMQEVRSPGNVTFMRDDWKAPHWSIQEPLRFIGNANAKRRIVVIGAVSDSPLGPSKRYPKIAKEARAVADYCIFIGPDAIKALKARTTAEDQTIQAFANLEDAACYLEDLFEPGDLVLLKGTNLQDHLIRLILNRERPISCWVNGCGRSMFCNRCDRLRSSEPIDVKKSLSDHNELGSQQRQERSEIESKSKATLLVVGLGNSSDMHNKTPHNVGFEVLDALVEKLGIPWDENAFGEVAQLDLSNGRVAQFFKPRGSINRSGETLGLFLKSQNVGTLKVNVVHDEMNLPVGEVRIQSKVGYGGHKGVRSVMSALGGDDFFRIRVGVRMRGDNRKAREIVLGQLSSTDEALLKAGVARAVDALLIELDQRDSAARGLLGAS